MSKFVSLVLTVVLLFCLQWVDARRRSDKQANVYNYNPKTGGQGGKYDSRKVEDACNNGQCYKKTKGGGMEQLDKAPKTKDGTHSGVWNGEKIIYH